MLLRLNVVVIVCCRVSQLTAKERKFVVVVIYSGTGL